MALTQVKTNGIANDAVTSSKIPNDAIGSTELSDDAITSSLIADDAITSALIADDAVVAAAIADDAVVAAAIADDAVVQAAIADDAVDEARLQISNAGSNGQFLSKQSGDTGGLTWATVAAGITEYDRWRITSTFTGTAEPVTDNWERNDNAGFEKIGTGMSESTGVFTFPSTGKWLITFYSYGWHNAETRWTSTQIDTTTDTGSNWLRQSNAYSATPGDPNSSHFSSNCDFLFDVTNVSTHKCRFVVKVGSSINATTAASTNTDNTFATFMKLGDT